MAPSSRPTVLRLARAVVVAAVALAVVASVPAAVVASTLGNGVIEPGEACDDGNLVDGDGCSATGTIEAECYDSGNVFSFFTWSDSYTSSGDSGVLRVFDDAVNAARYPGRVIPRFWVAPGDIPYMQDGTTRLDELNDEISNAADGQRYPFVCPASNGKFPYFVALGNHDIDGYISLTPRPSTTTGGTSSGPSSTARWWGSATSRSDRATGTTTARPTPSTTRTRIS